MHLREESEEKRRKKRVRLACDSTVLNLDIGCVDPATVTWSLLCVTQWQQRTFSFPINTCTRNVTLPPSRPLCSTLLELCRSGTVASSFDPAKLNGMWYEQAYTDIAQVGASCQTLNSTFVQPPNPASSNDGNVVMAFKVNYGKIPFTITELYTQNQPPVNGFYTKTAEMPGGKFLKLSTVFVDVRKQFRFTLNILYTRSAPEYISISPVHTGT